MHKLSSRLLPSGPPSYIFSRSKSSHARSSGKALSHAEQQLHHVQANTIKFVDVISSTKHKIEPEGWNHTESLRGTVKRLTSDIKDAERLSGNFAAEAWNSTATQLAPTRRKTDDASLLDRLHQTLDLSDKAPSTSNHIASTRAPSNEKLTYHAPRLEEDDQLETDIVIEPGDFVEMRRNDLITHGVLLGEEYVTDRWRLVILTSSGEIWTPLKEDVMFVISGSVPRDLAARCGLEVIALSRAEIMARAQVLKVIRDIDRSVEKTYADYVRSVRRVYSDLAKQDEWVQVTLHDAVRLLNPKPSLIVTFAIHKHLMASGKEFVADLMYQSNNIFSIRPRTHIDIIERVTSLIRQPEHLRNFAKRALPVMKANRERRRASWSEVPTEKPSSRTALWTEDDTTVLTFMLNSLRQVRSNQRDPYVIGQAAVLKALRVRNVDAHEHGTYQALADLGILSPWQDMVSLRPEYLTRPVSHNTDVSDFVSGSPNSSTSIPLHIEDPLEGVRHDFGDLPVYVIDDVGAHELDDGISIEAVPGSPDSFWVHVHVADPAAVLPQQHPWSLDARRRGETVYFVHQTLPMLPSSILDLSSLGRSSNANKPERVISFSARVDPVGNLVDYKVRAGLVRNVNILRYDEVDMAMHFQPPQPKFTYPFGHHPSPPSIAFPAKLLPTQLADMNALARVKHRIVKRRVDSGVYTIASPLASLTLSPNPFISSPNPPSQPKEYRGFPALDYKVYSESSIDVGSRSIVAEAMKLAGRVASRFFRDRGIPAIRRSSSPPYSDSLEKFLAARNENGCISFRDTLGHESYAPAAEYSVEPRGHWYLGVPPDEGYCRITSPLRRYMDLVGHWQLHQTLLGATGKPTIFTLDWLNDYCKHLSVEHRRSKRAKRSHEKFWQYYFLLRWMKRPDESAKFPDPLHKLTGVVISKPQSNLHTSTYQAKVILPTLGAEGFLDNLSAGEVDVGDEVPVGIAEVRLGVKPLLLLSLTRGRGRR